jgi:hypothetical protein
MYEHSCFVFEICYCVVIDIYSSVLTHVKAKTVNVSGELEHIKVVIRIRKSKNRQHNGKKKGQKDKHRSSKHTDKTKDRVTRTPLKIGVKSGSPEGAAVPVPLVVAVMLIY